METKVLAAIQKYGMLKAGDTAVVGLSGGADSCALLLVLLALRERLGITVKACHINHNLRGEESDGDEMFVRTLCAERGVPLTVFTIAGVVILTPVKKPTPRAIIAIIAKKRPNVPFISRRVVFLIAEPIPSPLYIRDINDIIVHTHT